MKNYLRKKLQNANEDLIHKYKGIEFIKLEADQNGETDYTFLNSDVCYSLEKFVNILTEMTA